MPYDPIKQEPPSQRHVIDFLADPAPGKKQPWVNLIIEYHRNLTFRGFWAIQPFFFPLANPKRGNDKPNGPKPTKPRTPQKPRK